MKTEELIVRLAADAAPVRRLPSISARLARWLFVAVPVVAVFVALVGARADLATRALAPAFLTSVLAVTALALVSAGTALVSSVPGHDRSRLATVVPLLLLLSWAMSLAARLAAGGSVGAQLVAEPFHAACALQISVMALLPAMVLLRAVQSGVSLAPRSSGALAIGAALAAGAVGSAFICPIDRAAHETLWHLLPVAACAAAGALISRAWLDRLER